MWFIRQSAAAACFVLIGQLTMMLRNTDATFANQPCVPGALGKTVSMYAGPNYIGPVPKAGVSGSLCVNTKASNVQYSATCAAVCCNTPSCACTGGSYVSCSGSVTSQTQCWVPSGSSNQIILSSSFCCDGFQQNSITQVCEVSTAASTTASTLSSTTTTATTTTTLPTTTTSATTTTKPSTTTIQSSTTTTQPSTTTTQSSTTTTTSTTNSPTTTTTSTTTTTLHQQNTQPTTTTTSSMSASSTPSFTLAAAPPDGASSTTTSATGTTTTSATGTTTTPSATNTTIPPGMSYTVGASSHVQCWYLAAHVILLVFVFYVV